MITNVYKTQTQKYFKTMFKRRGPNMNIMVSYLCDCVSCAALLLRPIPVGFCCLPSFLPVLSLREDNSNFKTPTTHIFSAATHAHKCNMWTELSTIIFRRC